MAATRTKRGQGSIRKLPSGKYQVRYTDPAGVRRTARITFDTARMAERELQLVRASIENGTWTADNTPQAGDLDPKTVTLRELAGYWRDQRTTSTGQALSPSTLGEYERLISSTLRDFADRPIREITTQQLERWRSPEMRRAPNQTVKAYKHLKTLMTWAYKRHWLASNPCNIERGTSYKSEEPETPSRKQVEIMLESANSPFDTLLTIAAWGGLRKGEILELRRKDVDKVQAEDGATFISLNVRRAVIWQGSQALVKTTKTAKSVREVLLPASASAQVDAYLKTLSIDPEALLFSNKPGLNEHWGEFKIKPLWAAVCKEAGFKGRFHSLRSFAMTQFAITGATNQDLMDRAGHSDIATAMRYQRGTGREFELIKKLG
jgi:integrase